MGPTIHVESGFRFSFVMGDPVKVERTHRLTQAESSRILVIVRKERDRFLEKWREARERAGH